MMGDGRWEMGDGRREEIDEVLAYSIVRSPFQSPLLLSIPPLSIPPLSFLPSPFSLLYKRVV